MAFQVLSSQNTSQSKTLLLCQADLSWNVSEKMETWYLIREVEVSNLKNVFLASS